MYGSNCRAAVGEAVREAPVALVVSVMADEGLVERTRADAGLGGRGCCVEAGLDEREEADEISDQRGSSRAATKASSNGFVCRSSKPPKWFARPAAWR